MIRLLRLSVTVLLLPVAALEERFIVSAGPLYARHPVVFSTGPGQSVVVGPFIEIVTFRRELLIHH